MDRFARLFTLQLQIGESGHPGSRCERDEQWRVIDRTIVLLGPPAILNQAWSLGVLDLPILEEDLFGDQPE